MSNHLREYITDEELKEAVAILTRYPHFYLLGYSAKYQLEKRFPETSLRLFSNVGTQKYWFGYKKNQFIKDHYLIGVDPHAKFDESEIAPLFDEFVRKVSLFNPHRNVMLIAESICTDFVRKWLRVHEPTAAPHDYPTQMFYMTAEQQSEVSHMRLALPEGYEFSCLDPEKDIDIVVSTWRHAEPGGDFEMCKAKLRNLPSACVCYNGEPVSFEFADHTGPQSHLFTLKEHRRKGLGSATELYLAKLLSGIGTTPFKFVELPNRATIAASGKSKLWSPLHRDGKDSFVVYQVVNFITWN